ncbi:MAG TPA: TrmH family RNA methyltransferase [Candidatus Sulfotelmatobacter sp.]
MKTPAVILINPKSPHNVGKALRAASIFGAKSLVWSGSRVDLSKYERLPREERMKGYASVEFCVSDRPFDLFKDATPVCVELLETAECLTTFVHPINPAYVFGPEDGSVPPVIRRHCHKFIYIPAYHCLNLSAAVDVVLYDRMAKRQTTGEEPVLPVSQMLHEGRGLSEALSNIGWEGE